MKPFVTFVVNYGLNHSGLRGKRSGSQHKYHLVENIFKKEIISGKYSLFLSQKIVLMENLKQIHLQEIIFPSRDPKQARLVAKLLKRGFIRKIAPRIYTSNFGEEPAVIIRRNIFNILGNLYPNAVLSHRSALEFKPTATGVIFLTYSYTKKIPLPGLTIRFLKGAGPIDGDIPFTGRLFYSQLERALLENLQSSRRPGADSKTMTIPEIENKLERVLGAKGEKGLNELREKARDISVIMGLNSEFGKLDRLIGALLNTRPLNVLSSPPAIARVMGAPYDPARIELFENLFGYLKQLVLPSRPDMNSDITAFRNFAFFESYFSNYIEGTKFSVDEARRIIETEAPLPARDEDSHDILGTYHLVSNVREMKITPEHPDQLIEILKYRHEVLLSARPSRGPGQFTDRNNMAEDTLFVDPTLVRGTLIRGFDYYHALTEPFARAAFIMFLISEVHPFQDGNGRLSRILMNAELVRGLQTKILIPTVYRDDYILTLRKLTRENDPQPYVRMLEKAQLFSQTVNGSMDEMQDHLEKCNAFREPDEANLVFILSAQK